MIILIIPTRLWVCRPPACLRPEGGRVKFTVIEPKEYFHHCVAALRAAVSPDWVARTAIPLSEAFGSSYLQGRVVRLDPGERTVSLEDGQSISFSHCVISVGSLGPEPARKSSP